MDNKDNKNVFEETVKTLTQDAMSLQQKFHKLQESNDIRASIDCLRLLKDTLSLIKEYDWHLEYSEYKTDGQKQVAVWEQNHCGEIRNHKVWNISNDKYDSGMWERMFEDYILTDKSIIVENGQKHRNTGKSYSLTKLCNKYGGVVVVDTNKTRACGIENNSKVLGCNVLVIDYKQVMTLRQYRDRILFVDEGSGLSDDQIEKLKNSGHIVIGFK